jgi:hypothetical protein
MRSTTYGSRKSKPGHRPWMASSSKSKRPWSCLTWQKCCQALCPSLFLQCLSCPAPMPLRALWQRARMYRMLRPATAFSSARTCAATFPTANHREFSLASPRWRSPAKRGPCRRDGVTELSRKSRIGRHHAQRRCAGWITHQRMTCSVSQS